MKIEKVSIGLVKSNPSNPRVIKDNKFRKLVKSIKDFPEMLEIRPIVVDDNMIVLGGNMRLKACKEAQLNEIYIIKVNNLTKEQQAEFIIKDNSSFGEWDWDVLKDEWDVILLDDWGLDVPEEKENNDDDDDDDNDEQPIISQMWFLNIQMDNENDCQIWYEKLQAEGLNCKIVQ
jgi:ParB-like chromosome segregation protein Spo0J